MTQDNLFTRYFDDTLRIYAICGDEEIPDHDARLLSYMHVKARESDNGIDYFTSPPACDEEAIGVLLGDLAIADTMVTARGEIVSLGNEDTSAVSATVRHLDTRFENEHGMEQRLSGELRSRLRLYQDERFREKMTRLYRERIAPRLSGYDREAVYRAFDRYREKKALEEAVEND